MPVDRHKRNQKECRYHEQGHPTKLHVIRQLITIGLTSSRLVFGILFLDNPDQQRPDGFHALDDEQVGIGLKEQFDFERARHLIHAGLQVLLY